VGPAAVNLAVQQWAQCNVLSGGPDLTTLSEFCAWATVNDWKKTGVFNPANPSNILSMNEAGLLFTVFTGNIPQIISQCAPIARPSC
jgi:hypothetical protein